MYYEAKITMITEEHDEEGCNLDIYQDHGVVQTITAPSLEELKKKIEKEYFDLEKPIGAGVQIFENRIEISYEGEHDYRTPKNERKPFIETVSIYISKVEKTNVDLSSEDLFSKIPRY